MPIKIHYGPSADEITLASGLPDPEITLTSGLPDFEGQFLKVTIKNPPVGCPLDDPVWLLKLVRRHFKEEMIADEVLMRLEAYGL